MLQKLTRTTLGLAALALLSLFPLSCRREAPAESILLPPTPVLSVRSSWGVVTSSFLRIREEPYQRAKILAHLRQGTVLEIISYTDEKVVIEDEAAYWYHVSHEGLRGWVFGAYLEILDSRVKARAFAGGL